MVFAGGKLFFFEGSLTGHRWCKADYPDIPLPMPFLLAMVAPNALVERLGGGMSTNFEIRTNFGTP
jgi:hypothetical protein